MTEPALVQTAENVVQIFLRNREKEDAGRKMMCATFDPITNEIFAARPTDLPNPDSGIDAVRLPDGRMVLAANPCTKGRSPLSLLISTDEGYSWKPLVTLESGPGDFSQPALLLAKNGFLHVIYSWCPINKAEQNIMHKVVNLAGL